MCEQEADGERKTTKKETHFSCIFFSRIVYQCLPAECHPVSIIQSKESADMALVTTRQCGIPVYMQTWVMAFRVESLMAWHCAYQMRILQMQ